MIFTRREFSSLAVAAAAMAADKPKSRWGGVQVGVITYSFRAMPGSSAEDTLRYIVDSGLSGIELMSNVAESFAGAPAAAGGPRGPMTPENQAAMKKAAQETRAWRMAAKMDKFKALRRMYEDAGVKIYAFKLPPTMAMSDAEYEYIWNAAETLGANHITMELPTDDALLQRVAEYAAKRKLWIAFHTHGQGGQSGFDKALAASTHTALNLDVGHYYGVNGESPVPVIEKYHARIASLHLKDRKGPGAATDKKGRGGPNMPWGQGETPLREILQTMKRRKFKFPASIEYEYETPAGSDVLTEVKKCVAYCQGVLG